MKNTRIFLLVLISTFEVLACKKDETNNDPKEDEVLAKINLTTTGITNITNQSAESGVTIQVTGNGNIDEVGICWSTNNSPTINDAFVSGSETSTDYTNSSKSFELNILNLDSNTNYFVRAYAKYKDSVYYGNEQSFTTKSSEETVDQFWTLGSIFNMTSFYSNYEEDEARIVLAVFGEDSIACEIKLGNSLQPPLEYSIVNEGEALATLDASIKLLKKSDEWQSIEGESKIKTTLEGDKIKVEFVDVEMKNINDNSIVKTSALFYITQ